LPPSEMPRIHPRDPSLPREPLRTSFDSRSRGEARVAQDQTQPVRTALAVEPRDGFINVFLPPFETVEDYLELVATAEETAAELSAPLRIEGYPPPADARLNQIRI